MNFFQKKINKLAAWVAVHPAISRLTVTKKIVAAYLLIGLFSLIAIVFAITSLHQQTTASNELVHKDIKSIALTKELQKSLISQEKLEKQYLIIQRPETRDLILQKHDTFPRLWSEFLPLLDKDQRESISLFYKKYRAEGSKYQELLKNDIALKTLDKSYNKNLLPAHNDFYAQLTSFRDMHQLKIDAALEVLSNDSRRAFRITLILLLFGFFLATPVAITVILSIHHSMHRLTRATMQIADGNYEVEINLLEHDEFGKLAREFQKMGRKLQEVEASNLDANPLTHLPGNMVIQRRVEELLKNKIPFAHAFVDLDHFKAYNDRYGYQKGSDIISAVGDIIAAVIEAGGDEDDFVGHIGGDDYIFLTSTEKVEKLSSEVIEKFDEMIPEMYSDEDRQSGFFICQDRFGVERQFPLMTISISIICSDTSNYDSAIAISHECAKMKEHLKRLPGSNYLIDRRRGKS